MIGTVTTVTVSVENWRTLGRERGRVRFINKGFGVPGGVGLLYLVWRYNGRKVSRMSSHQTELQRGVSPGLRHTRQGAAGEQENLSPSSQEGQA